MVAIMSNRKNNREFADMLDTQDVGYLASVYEMSEDFVRGMNDDEWCAFLGCTISELPYFLFEDEIAPFATIDGEPIEAFEDEVEFDDLDTDATLFSIEAYLKKQDKKPVAKKPTVFASEYARPSAFAAKAKAPKVVPHHFEVIR